MKTVAICHYFDVVCGITFLADPVRHVKYSREEMGFLADRLYTKIR
jgi:hypothetical protein